MSDVKIAQELNVFYHLVPELYREELCTANMHILAHLSESVQNWGPLWAYSCFGFESMNSHLCANCHGFHYVLPQLVRTIRMRQILIAKGRKIAERSGSPELVAFIHSLCGKPSSNCMIEVKGRVSQKKIDGSVLAALKSTRFVSDSVDSTFLPCCDSIRFKSIIYTVAPKKKNYRNGYFCVFEHDSGLKFRSIIQFCFCDMDNIAIIKSFSILSNYYRHYSTLPSFKIN